MNAKLLLSGIVLLTVFTGCSDRNEEVSKPISQSQKSINAKLEKTEAAKVVSDSLNTENLNGNNTKEDATIAPEQETIDPTKPDRPK